MLSSSALTAVGAGAAGAAIGAALPHFIAKKPVSAPPKALPPPTGAPAPVGRQPPGAGAPPAGQVKPTPSSGAAPVTTAPGPQARPVRKTPAPGTAAPRERMQEHGRGAPPRDAGWPGAVRAKAAHAWPGVPTRARSDHPDGAPGASSRARPGGEEAALRDRERQASLPVKRCVAPFGSRRSVRRTGG